MRTNLITIARDKDPAMAIVLRARFTADVKRRFVFLKRVIRESIIENDCFGLKPNKLITFAEKSNLTPLEEKALQFETDDKKIKEFNNWLKEQIEKGVLEQDENGAWTNNYIKEGYEKGTKLSRDDLYKLTKLNQFRTTPAQIAGQMGQSVNIERLQALYTRTFDQLEGITKAMSSQISRILTSGLLENKTPFQIANEINNRVDKIGISRAKKLVRTELQYTINFAILKDYEKASTELGEEVKVRWWTMRDERVRKRHKAWHNKIFTIRQAMGMIGAINCRCSCLPYIKKWEN